ncbi:hypothetical protein CRE_09326 [Caenorhabditis remanei]|uniref:Uncharacterized protein n=1 Tax=Caenorhabditis remanei TaxID=31234 RepID=E3LI59_CAERE|nr:hypothetical protein CRE_09326 [Caenorhabditis remanei]
MHSECTPYNSLTQYKDLKPRPEGYNKSLFAREAEDFESNVDMFFKNCNTWMRGEPIIREVDLWNLTICILRPVPPAQIFPAPAQLRKFADKIPNVAAYRADIYTLMGVGRKKTAQFPKKLMFADLRKNESPEQYNNIQPWTLTSSSESESENDRLPKFRRPHLLAVLPTITMQKAILDSMIQHALLHLSEIDGDTVFRYGETNLMTFLASGILSQFICSTDDRLNFLSHQHRRHSALFDKLFELKMLQTIPSEDSESSESPCGFKATSFHPELPTIKKTTHEKKLADVNLKLGLQYPVQILPRKNLSLSGKEVTSENGLGRSLVDYACFLTQIGRQPNAKGVEQVVRSLWPQSADSIPPDVLSDHKIGQIPVDHLESIFQHVHKELQSTQIAQAYCNELKIKRVV